VSTSHGPSDVGRRRRLDVVLLALVVVAVGALATAVAAASDGQRVTQLWIAATVADDGSARITEVMDWDFGRSRRHGVFRDVPALRTSAPVEASSPDAPAAVEVNTVGTPRIRIGDPDRTVTGSHRYVLTYTLDGVVRGGRLAWNALGTTWEAPVEHVEVHVRTPTALSGAECVTGAQGSHSPCAIQPVAPGHLVARIDALDTGEGVAVAAATGPALAGIPALPPPPPAPAPLRGVDPFLPGALAAGLALLAAALATQPILRAGREHVPTVGVPLTVPPGDRARIDLAELAEHVVPTPSVPAGLSPAEGGVLLAGQVLDQHKAAWLIDQAVGGVIDLVPADTRPRRWPWSGCSPGTRTPPVCWTSPSRGGSG
jgi:Predicted membrane protein (DUF2207)